MKNTICLVAALTVASLSFVGCGGGDVEHKQEYPKESQSAQVGRSIKQQLDEIQTALKTEGVKGAANTTMSTMENLDGITEEEKGDQAATIDQVRDGVKKLHEMFKANKSCAEIEKQLQSVMETAKKLPGDTAGQATPGNS